MPILYSVGTDMCKAPTKDTAQRALPFLRYEKRAVPIPVHSLDFLSVIVCAWTAEKWTGKAFLLSMTKKKPLTLWTRTERQNIEMG